MRFFLSDFEILCMNSCISIINLPSIWWCIWCSLRFLVFLLKQLTYSSLNPDSCCKNNSTGQLDTFKKFSWLTFRQSKQLSHPSLSQSISLSLVEELHLWKEQVISLQCVTTVQITYGFVPSDVTRLSFILQLYLGKDNNHA